MENKVKRRWGIVLLAVVLFICTTILTMAFRQKTSLYYVLWLMVGFYAYKSNLVAIKKQIVIWNVTELLVIVISYLFVGDNSLDFVKEIKDKSAENSLTVFAIMLVPSALIYLYCNKEIKPELTSTNSNNTNPQFNYENTNIKKENTNQKNEKLVESNSQTVSIKNKNVEVGKNKVIDSMEDAYIRATEFKSESKKSLIDKNNSINVPKNKRIESMEDAYSQIAQEKVSIEKIHEPNKVHSKNIEEEKIWELVAEEFDSDYRKKGLYARLFVEMNGDEKKIQVMYYKIRVEELINETPFAEKLETNNIEKEKINYELASDEECISNGWYKKEWIREFTCLLLHNGKAVVDRAEIQIIYKDIAAVKNAIAGYGVTGKFGDYKKIKEINKS